MLLLLPVEMPLLPAAAAAAAAGAVKLMRGCDARTSGAGGVRT
jgi:hypothetical protein